MIINRQTVVLNEDIFSQNFEENIFSQKQLKKMFGGIFLDTLRKICQNTTVKSVRIRSFSGPYFPALGLNTEGYSVSLHIQVKCAKTRTKKTPNMDTFTQCTGQREPVLWHILRSDT